MGFTWRRGSDVIHKICQRAETHHRLIVCRLRVCVCMVLKDREAIAVDVLGIYLFNPVISLSLFLFHGRNYVNQSVSNGMANPTAELELG